MFFQRLKQPEDMGRLFGCRVRLHHQNTGTLHSPDASAGRFRQAFLIDVPVEARAVAISQNTTAQHGCIVVGVDLSTLSEQLVAVVQETMQPTHVSLWLRPPEGQEERNAETGVSNPPV